MNPVSFLSSGDNMLTAARIAFLLLVGLLLAGWLLGRGKDPVTPKFRINRVCFAFFAATLFGVYAYQATWQLGGFARPAFMEFMRKYNRRPDNQARRMVRGAILDRNGVVLAVADPVSPGRRCYPLSRAACHVVGYVDATYGMTGVEAADHAFLEGYGYADPAERQRFGRNLVQRDALRGNDLALTIDAGLQQTATRLLEGRRGAAVVLDPRNGDVLALVSAPAFDPGALTADLFTASGDATALLNRATQGLYPPGSTFKIVVAALALEDGFNGTFDCPASGYIPGSGMKPIRDHEYYSAERRGRTWGGHGRLDLKSALAKSSNVFFAQLGAHLGPARFYDEANRFQFNRTVSLFEGASGSVRCKTGVFPELKPTQRAAASQLAMGQGTLVVTPFGMALVAAAIANDGRMPQPRLSSRQPEVVLSACMTPDAARRLRALMRAVVTDGTARAADLPGLQVAGKTGTAETPRGEDHSWFVCMAPEERPQLVVVALVEHGGFGSAAALPVAVGLLNAAKTQGWFGGK